MQSKTPLRYPGGKSRAMKVLGKYFPKEIKHYREPFLGGGSVALWVAKNYPDAEIWVNDLYYNLYCFWDVLQKDSNSLMNTLWNIKSKVGDDGDLGRDLFYDIKTKISTATDFDKAVYMFVLNRMSFSGLGESSGISVAAQKSNFSFSSINKLGLYSRIIEKWKITNLDYRQMFDEDVFIFHDPPYEIDSKLYGKGGKLHTDFDHDEFADACNASGAQQMITYNSDQNVINRFPNWKQTEWDLTYTMRSDAKYTAAQKDRRELILTNY